MPDCIESQILDALDTKLKTLPWVKLVATDKIRLMACDFREHELPAIQVYDVGGTATQMKGQIQNSWFLAIEIVMKPTRTGHVDNRDLMNYRRDVVELLGQDPRLVNVAGMLHIQYNDFINDLHLLEPLYMTRMTWEVIYLANYSGC